MTETVLAAEPNIRTLAFIGVFGAVALWEWLTPRRKRAFPCWLRWLNNFGIILIDMLAVRLLLPLAAVGWASLCAEQGWGLFNVVELPAWLAVVLSILVLDLTIYGQHVLFHAIPALWRLHRVHHADLDFDVTTGIRFHPVEILLSMGIKLGMVALLGAPALAVLIFEVLLNATSMFNHGNIRMPKRLDRVLRWIVVTPDMHRVHHSIERHETDSNFGFNLPWWDRLCGTYRPQPTDGHEGMTIGIPQFRSRRDLWLDRLLLQPFRDRDHRSIS